MRIFEIKVCLCVCVLNFIFIFFFSIQSFTQPTDSITNCNVIERLKKRIGGYRQHHTVCSPRFDQNFDGACKQQSIETGLLQKRYVENKAKKAAKKTDKKQLENAGQANNLQNSVQVVSIEFVV